MSGEEVESLAQGRVWMGLKAFDNRLVDYKFEIRIIVTMDYSWIKITFR